MQLYRRADSQYWWVHYTLNGQGVRKSTKRRNRKEAELVAATWYREAHDTAQLGVKPEISLADATGRYLNTMKEAASLVDLTRNRDKLLGLGQWRGKVFNLRADMKMSDLRTHMVSQLRERRKAEGLSNNSVNLEIKFLQRVYNLCRKEWGYSVDPDVIFTTLKVRPKTRYLSDTEAAAVLAYLDRPSPAYQKALVLATVLLDTGLRYSEALNLRWSQIEFDAGRIRVYRQKTKSWSTVPLTERAADVLDRSKGQRQPFLSMDRAIKVLRRAIDEVCNLDDYVIRSSGRATIHSLRDSYATKLVRNGMTLYQVSKLLGHTSTQMSSKYSHLEVDTVADDARRILEKRA